MIILVTKPISITPVLSLARKASEKILPVKTITQGKSKPLVENIFSYQSSYWGMSTLAVPVLLMQFLDCFEQASSNWWRLTMRTLMRRSAVIFGKERGLTFSSQWLGARNRACAIGQCKFTKCSVKFGDMNPIKFAQAFLNGLNKRNQFSTKCVTPTNNAMLWGSANTHSNTSKGQMSLFSAQTHKEDHITYSRSMFTPCVGHLAFLPSFSYESTTSRVVVRASTRLFFLPVSQCSSSTSSPGHLCPILCRHDNASASLFRLTCVMPVRHVWPTWKSRRARPSCNTYVEVPTFARQVHYLCSSFSRSSPLLPCVRNTGNKGTQGQGNTLYKGTPL